MNKLQSNEKITKFPVGKLKILENSRLRTQENLNELMKSIKQVGVLQPILVRARDNAVIMGNRRLMACKKLGMTLVPVIMKDNLEDDTDLYIMNLTENIQRKDITTIEIGRFCSGLKSGELTGTKLSIPEIAVRLGIPETRVNVCVNIYERLPKKFRKEVKFFGKGGSGLGVPESIINSVLGIHNNMKKLTDKEFTLIIEAIKNKNLQQTQLKALGNLLVSGLTIEEALRKIDTYVLKQFAVLINKKALGKALAKNKCQSFPALIREWMKKEDEDFLI